MKRDFQITSREGLPIRGTLAHPPGSRAIVVIIHGFKGFKEWGFFPWISEQLAAERIASCRFNMSRSGVGTDDEHFDRLDLFSDDTYTAELDDLKSVLQYIDSHESTRHLPLFLFGHSRGGAIAILGASSSPECEGIITWSSISKVDRWDAATVEAWRRDGVIMILNQRTGQQMPMSTRILDDLEAHREELDVDAALANLHTPLLVVHGERDESVPVGEARHIAATAPNATLVVIAEGSHTYGAIHPLVNVPRELRVAMTVTRKFVQAYA
jgi:Dipeptidyl aminopeptidases/acylaminoacyl-peptidases